MLNYKKSQILILSGMFLIIMLISFYYIETNKFYINKIDNNNILNNIIYETCIIGYNSNGTQINSRYEKFINNISIYCNQRGNYCNLIIKNNTPIPPSGNWSLLNYTHYDYNINYSWNDYNTNLKFNC